MDDQTRAMLIEESLNGEVAVTITNRHNLPLNLSMESIRILRMAMTLYIAHLGVDCPGCITHGIELCHIHGTGRAKDQGYSLE